jgi:hypothetical protein
MTKCPELQSSNLIRVNDVQNLLKFIQEHDLEMDVITELKSPELCFYLFRTVDFWPVFEQSHHHLNRQRWVLVNELHNAIGQLRVIGVEVFGL